MYVYVFLLFLFLFWQCNDSLFFVFKKGIGIERKTIGGDKKKGHTHRWTNFLLYCCCSLLCTYEFAQKPVDFRLNKLLQFFVCPVGAVAGGDFL